MIYAEISPYKTPGSKKHRIEFYGQFAKGNWIDWDYLLHNEKKETTETGDTWEISDSLHFLAENDFIPISKTFFYKP